MHSISKDDLRDMVRFYADVRHATERFSDADVDRCLDYGMAKYWQLITASLSWPYVRETNVTLVDNTTSYLLPAHGRTISVDMQSGDLYTTIHRSSIVIADNPGVSGYGLEYSEYATSTAQYLKIHCRSIPAGKVVRVRYLAPYPKVSTGDLDDGFLFPSGWEEIPTLWAAIRLMAIDQEDSSQLRAILDDAIARMGEESRFLDVSQGTSAQGQVPQSFYAKGSRDGAVYP